MIETLSQMASAQLRGHNALSLERIATAVPGNKLLPSVEREAGLAQENDIRQVLSGRLSQLSTALDDASSSDSAQPSVNIWFNSVVFSFKKELSK